MTLSKEMNEIMLELEKVTPAYIVIHKTKRGSWRISYNYTKEEKEELKSILFNQVISEEKQ